MEHTSDTVSIGKLIHETTYNQRSGRYQEIEIGPVKIDFYDAKNKVVHEVKKSSRLHESHLWQVKYYIYLLENAGIDGVTGILEYPKERKKEDVFLSDRDKEELKEIMNKINLIIHNTEVPELLHQPRCKKCSYYDFCYANE